MTIAPEIETGKLLPNSGYQQMFIHQAEKLDENVWLVGYTADVKGRSNVRRYAIIKWSDTPLRWNLSIYTRSGMRWGGRHLFVESVYSDNGPMMEIRLAQGEFDQAIFWMKHLYEGKKKWELLR